MADSAVSHPYYPQDLLLSNYVPNDLGLAHLLVGFSCGVFVLAGLAILLPKRFKPRLSLADRSLVVWFVLSACSSPLFV